MGTPAGERASALQPHVERAHQAVGDLAGQVSALEAEARRCYQAAEPGAGHAAMARAVELRTELDAAEKLAAALGEAHLAVAAEHQREVQVARLAEVEQQLQDAMDEASRQLAGVLPALGLARRSILSAEKLEAVARLLDSERRTLRAALEGSNTIGPPSSGINRVEARVTASALLLAVRNHPEL